MRDRSRAAGIEPTLDPVELERRSMAAGTQRGQGGVEEARRGWPLLTRLGIALCAALLAAYLALWASTVQSNNGPEGYVRVTDFVSTLTGALMIREGDGGQLYDLNAQRAAQNRVLAPYSTLTGGKMLPYNHLPFEALLVSPFIQLPYWFAFALWTLLGGLAIGLAIGMLDGALPVTRPVGWLISVAACSYLPVIRSLILGQNSAFVLLGLCGTYTALKRGREGWAGVALLLVALKPQLLPVVLLLVALEKRWRALGVFGGLMALLSVALMPVLGVGWPVSYLTLLLGVANWGDSAAIDPGIMHNWRGLVTDLIGGSAPGIVTPLFVLLSLLSVALIVWAWMRRSRGGAVVLGGEYMPGYDLLWAAGVIVAVLTSLHLNPHDLTLLVLPAWIMAAYAASGLLGRGVSLLWLGVLWAGYVLAPLTLYSDANARNPAVSVVPSVLLMALAAGLLAWRTRQNRGAGSPAQYSANY